jgi:hypothetical protein
MRNPQVDEIDEFFLEAAALKMNVHPAEGLVSCGRSLGVVDAIAHDDSLD